MAPLDNSISLELEGPDTPDIPRFKTLNKVYEMQLQSLYASKKKAYKLFNDVSKQILDNKLRFEQEGGPLSQIQPRVLQRLYIVMDEFDENKKTSINNIKAMTDCLVADNDNPVDNRMLTKCKGKIAMIEQMSIDLSAKGETLTTVLYKQQQQQLHQPAPASTEHSANST